MAAGGLALEVHVAGRLLSAVAMGLVPVLAGGLLSAVAWGLAPVLAGGLPSAVTWGAVLLGGGSLGGGASLKNKSVLGLLVSCFLLRGGTCFSCGELLLFEGRQ